MSDLAALTWVGQVEPEDIEKLEALAKTTPEGSDATWIVLEHAANRLQIWRCADGLVVTQLLTNPNGKELFVYGIVGRGIIGRLEDAANDLKQIAKSFGCNKIGGNVLRKGLEKLYLALGARPVYTYYAMEVE